MPRVEPGADLVKFLGGRYIATLATQNGDGSIHLTAVWFLFEAGCLFVATSSRSRKVRNILARPKASLMVDSRKPGSERGVSASGTAEIMTGERARAVNLCIHSRYMSGVAVADPRVGGVFASLDDVAIKLEPDSWISWDMAALDGQVFGGLIGGTPGYLLPLDG